MSKTTRISVIMSTYNRCDLLSSSIESILSQTFEDFEFILVNNGSTDKTLELCLSYAAKDKRIKLINIATNKGASIGRNKGISSAKGQFITLVDDDDYCLPEMLEFLWGLSQEHDADISMCGSWNDVDGELEPYFIFNELLLLDKVQGLNELLLREKYNVAPPTKLFRKSMFEGIKFKENVRVDDIHVIYKVFANANKVVAQGKPLYSFRKHQGNMTSFIQTNQITPDILREYLYAFRERTKYLSDKVPQIAPRARYAELSYMISMCDKIPNSIDYMMLRQEMIERLKGSYDELANSLFVTERERRILEDILLW